MFDKLLAIFLIGSVLNYAPGIDMYIFADRYLMIGAICLLGVSFLFCQPKRYLIPKWPLALLLFCVWHFYSKPYHVLSQHALFNIFFSLVVFYIVLNFAEDVRWILWATIAASLINMLWATGQMFHFDPIFKTPGLPIGFMIDHQSLAGYITLAMPLFSYYGLAFFIPMAFMILMNSFTSMIVMFLAGIAITLRRGFYPIAFVLVLTITIVAFLHQPNFKMKIKSRMPLYEQTLSAAFLAPLSGYGLGRFVEFGSQVDKVSNVNYFTAKNDYFEFGWEVGAVVALIIIVYIFSQLAGRYRRAEKTWMLKAVSISLLSFAMTILFQSHLRNPKIVPTVMSLLAVFYILTEKQKGAKQNVY